MFKKINNLFVFIKEKLLKDDLHQVKQADILFFCHDNNRGIDLNGKAYSPILDSYSEELQREGYTVQTLAHPWSKLNGDLAFGQPILFNRSYFFAKVLDKVFKRNKVKNLYIRIFNIISPKIIITIGCNDELCKAARELNIKHIEILHGLGYNPIPWNWDKKNKECLPQYIYTLDEVSTKTFKYLNKYGVVVNQIEHPFLKRFYKNKVSNLVPVEWRIEPRIDFKKQILISLQWGYTSGLDCYPEFEGILNNGLFPEELIPIILETENEILWRFRFHPVHYRNKDKYEKHFNFIKNLTHKYNNCEWEDSTYKPLPSVLQHCVGHLTMSSMSSYEAAYMGVPTLALCPTLRERGINSEMFDDLLEIKYLTKSVIGYDCIKDWVINISKLNVD